MPETQKKQRSLAERIVGASIVVGIAHLCLKFMGLIQVKVAGHFLSTDQYEVVYATAFQGVIWSLFLIGEEIIGPTFLPVFMREYDDKGEQAAWDFTNVLLTFQVIILLVTTAVVMCFPELMIRICTEWTAEGNPEQYSMLRTALPWLAPSLLCLSIGSTTYMILNGYKKFFLAAFGDASWKICVVVCLLLGMGVFGWDYRALVVGLCIGSVAKLITHLIGMPGKLKFFRPSFDFRSPALRTMLILMLPLLAGIVFAKYRDLFNNVRILTHLRQKGVLQANDYGRKLFASLQWLVPYALQIALFPFLCELVDRKDWKKLGEVLSTSCRLLLSAFVPVSILIAVLAKPIAVFIFLGGKTGLQVALWAGLSTACYILVLPAASVECILMQGYFADRKTVSVTLIGIGTSILSVLLSYVFIVKFQVRAVQGLMVVSLGFVVSRYLKSTILTLVIRRSIPMFPWGETLSFLVRLVLLGAVVGAVTWGLSKSMDRVLPDGLAEAELALRSQVQADGTTMLADAGGVAVDRFRMLIKLAVSGTAGALAFLGGAWVLRIREPFDMVQWSFGKALGKFRRE